MAKKRTLGNLLSVILLSIIVLCVTAFGPMSSTATADDGGGGIGPMPIDNHPPDTSQGSHSVSPSSNDLLLEIFVQTVSNMF